MKALDLRKIGKPYFGYEDIARVLNISPNSAKVAASRYVKAGILIRIKRNLYVLFENWAVMSLEQKFTIANLIQVPSYISLMTALGYYEITTQLQQDYIESVGVRRTKDAEPEKAFVDALYLQSLGRRSIDTSSLDVDKLDWPMVLQISKSFPKSTRRLVKRYERFGKT